MTKKKLKCRTCKKKLRDGYIQIGQGANKPLLSFCNIECEDKYEDYKKRGKLWKLKGSK